MGRSLISSFLLLFAAANSLADEAVYLVNFAIVPVSTGKGCAFAMARDVNQHTIANFQPSKAFAEAACSHFHAVWRPGLPTNSAKLEYVAALWHRDTPDTPTFMQQAEE